ncbi:hypothetical protein DFO77_10561 [Marinilabilia salmonicolor]|uniref:Uncharacterized protein n=1 Tax=Marinilabilia salmonicolor TaxID=989 RepID=A0A2T0XBR6_9BACT|nr:hypothetical protein BY457_11525 [Marinilabilia salmonicolor]RCW37553.1 hypothetical protein DFO77_10561 [Marinilabilia salmonicolor]
MRQTYIFHRKNVSLLSFIRYHNNDYGILLMKRAWQRLPQEKLHKFLYESSIRPYKINIFLRMK